MGQGFLFHRAVAQLVAETARNLSESLILPFDVKNYAQFLNQDVKSYENRYTEVLVKNGAKFGKGLRRWKYYQTDCFICAADRSLSSSS